MYGEAAKQEDRECCSDKACGSTWSFPRDNLAVMLLISKEEIARNMIWFYRNKTDWD